MSDEKNNSEQKQESPASEPSQTPPSSTPPNPAPKQDNSKLCAALSYLLVGIIWYFADDELNKDEFVKFHVKQGIVVLVLSVIGNSVLGATIVLAFLMPLYSLAIIVLIIIGIVNVSNNEKKELPVIGQLADKYLKF